jgi:hypothetical protein
MLGPPNQGSEVVDRLRSWWLFRRINGPAGSQLGTGVDSVPNSLGPVKFVLGVIAGDRSINWINSLLIAGPDDGKVSIKRTRVDGMKEHIVVHVSLPFLMKDKSAIAATLRFVNSGSFGAKTPNKAPEPTPGAVTPCAVESFFEVNVICSVARGTPAPRRGSFLTLGESKVAHLRRAFRSPLTVALPDFVSRAEKSYSDARHSDSCSETPK